MTYDAVHRFFLRSIASRGVISMKDAEKLLDSFPENTNTSPTDLVNDINEKIRPFQQKIKITNDELTSEEVIVFLSLGYDNATQVQNVFSKNELDYFRILIEEIMTTASRQITGIHAINLVNKMNNSFSKTDAQRLLHTWCRMLYLAEDDTNYALGIRGIHEFESYLRQNMPDTIEECFLCKQIVFRGYNCPACGLAVHTLCLNKYLEKLPKWPCCKLDFSESQLQALNSEGATQAQNMATRTQQSEVYDTVVEAATPEETSMEEEKTQEFVPGISQRLSRKRKWPDS